MSARFEDYSFDVVYYDLPASSIEGDNVGAAYPGASGDIVQRRNGIVVATRKWATARKWSLVFKGLDTTQITNLRNYWAKRSFYLYPSYPGTKYHVAWPGDFSPAAVSPGVYNLTVELEEVV